MKIFVIFLISFSVLGHCFMAMANAETITNPIEKAESELEKIAIRSEVPLRDVHVNTESYFQLLSIFNEFKDYDINFTSELVNKVKNHRTLSGDDLFTLKRTITTYYKINQKILDFAKIYDFNRLKLSKTLASKNKKIPLIKAHLIYLSGHLVVLDHLETMHNILYENGGKFRRIVKNVLKDKGSDSEEKSKTVNDLIKMSSYTVEIGQSSRFTEQLNLVRAISNELKDTVKDEPLAVSLIDLIINNKTGQEISQGREKFHAQEYSYLDAFLQTVDNVTGWLSRLFGNAAGAVKWRKGHLYENESAYNLIVNTLRPMDILLEKTPFILTDKFIPGHYGHAAVYLGTKEELEELNIWNHPSILPYQDDIENGNSILEAVRSGVRLTSVSDFLNIDELAIIRKEDGLKNIDQVISSINRGMDQLGKKYDFNFDIATLDKIVCSELVYITYGSVRWPTQYRLGRATVTPDDLAEILFQKNTKFKIQRFLVGKSSQRIELTGLDYLADILDYELRTHEGNPIADEFDDLNSYWKKDTKCYNVSEPSYENGVNYGYVPGDQPMIERRVCKTSYKEFYYEERDTL